MKIPIFALDSAINEMEKDDRAALPAVDEMDVYGVNNGSRISYFFIHGGKYMVLEPDVVMSRIDKNMKENDAFRFILFCERLDRLYAASEDGSFKLDDEMAEGLNWAYRNFSKELPTGKIGHD